MTANHRVTSNMRNILDALLTAHEQREKLCGADLVRCTGESSGLVYPTLARLEARGQLRRKWVHPRTGERPHRTCWLTSAGVTKARDLLNRPEPPASTEPGE